MKKPQHSSLMTAGRATQRGATLIVGLVLLLVLTVVGVSGMNMATMEITMAGNTQTQQDAFQLAEDAIDNALATENYTTAGPRTVNPLGVPDFDRRALTTFVEPLTDIPDEANSAGVAGAMKAYHFTVVATSEGPRNAAAAHTQGFYIRGRSE